MQQPEEAAAEAEAERGRRLRLEMEAGVVQAQFRQALAQLLEVARVDGKSAAEDDRDRGLESGERLGCLARRVCQGITDAGLADILDGGGEIADLAGTEAFWLYWTVVFELEVTGNSSSKACQNMPSPIISTHCETSVAKMHQ